MDDAARREEELESLGFTGSEEPLYDALKKIILKHRGATRVVAKDNVMFQNGPRRGYVNVKYFPNVDRTSQYMYARNKKTLLITHVLISSSKPKSENIVDSTANALLHDPDIAELLDAVGVEAVLSERFGEHLESKGWQVKGENNYIKERPEKPAISEAPVNPVNPLGHLLFEPKTPENSEFLNEKLAFFGSADANCEVIPEALEDTPVKQHFLYLHDNEKLYGIISNGEVEEVDGNMFYYSRTSCALDRLDIFDHNELSSGRVLRAFNLDHVYHRKTNQRPFIFWGSVVRDALASNTALGLKPLADIRDHAGVDIPQSRPMMDYVRRMCDEDGLPERFHYNPELSNLLFFYMGGIADKVVTPYNVVQWVLPKSKKRGGTRKRKRAANRKRKSRRF